MAVRCEILSSETVFHEFVRVEKAVIRWERFNGGMGSACSRYVVRRGDSVGIVPRCSETGRIVLVKQFRFPAHRGGSDGYLWEIPAGMIDGGEKPVDTALRELSEEIGLEANSVAPLLSYYLSPGLLDEKMHLFLARLGSCSRLESLGGRHEEEEELLIRSFGTEELLAMIREGEIIDAKSVAALLYVLFQLPSEA
jgi:nudix-type nucleoside diphosphatase (YffH/AdpP family)